MNAIDLLKKKLWKVTIGEGAWLAEVYGCDKTELARVAGRTTFADIVEGGWEDNFFCRDTPVGFWGGPPDNENWYNGTLLTFLIDNILRAQVHRDIGFAWLLGFNDAAIGSLKTQIGAHEPDALRQKTFQWEVEDCPFDNPVVDYLQIGDDIYPIHEDRSQGCVVQRAGTAIPIRATSDATKLNDTTTVYRWSSSCCTGSTCVS